ncbi:uncharacterized protein KY384_002474 [Bacidia gigantensis]|uniref:uncharacterized protein n=1 Tax=Bacidia gigantensis TaxID=2732470 RepID=UPI001D051E07|nr:uncharacterized protein KY384_002474 [Bacidia gigantensis]KAG8532597.1 hypothetical protein KY384_002474 [Bacidia gigantensis]
MAPAEVIYQEAPPWKGAANNLLLEKDETEKQLEKLVFGDHVGFHENLKLVGDPNGLSNEEYKDLVEQASVHGSDEESLGDVDDSQLFFLDSGPSKVNGSKLVKPTLQNEADGSDDEPAWIDSDDERLVISLASNSRLRKLRVTEAEDLVNGKEYTKRLRQQFERLYPPPEWANPSARKQKRRKSNASDGFEQSPADDMSIDSDDLSAQPLDKLLQSTAPLTQQSFTIPGGRRKLRPEKIDVHRLKDIGGTQPVLPPPVPSHPFPSSSAL